MKKPSFLKMPADHGLKTACSVIALTAGLAAGGAWAADQGTRHHARGEYDTVTATYTVVEGDELIVIGERFEIPVDTLKARSKLTSNEIKPGQKLTIAAAADGKKPNIFFIMGDDIGWMQPVAYQHGLRSGKPPTSTASRRRARYSWTTSRCRAAPPGATPSSPACIRCAPA